MSRLARLAAVVVGAAVGAALLIEYAPGRARTVGGAVVLLVGVSTLALARWQLGRAFSASFVPKAKGLVTTGLYSRIPHPMYAAMVVTLLGVALVLGRLWLVPVWAGCVLEAAWYARRESRLLERTFGDSYREYRHRTWW